MKVSTKGFDKWLAINAVSAATRFCLTIVYAAGVMRFRACLSYLRGIERSLMVFGLAQYV
jgi:hypothetical protein